MKSVSEALQIPKRCMARHPGREMGVQHTVKLTGVTGRKKSGPA